MRYVGEQVPREILYKEIEDTKEESRKRKATIVNLENQLQEAVDTIEHLNEVQIEIAKQATPDTCEATTETEPDAPTATVFAGMVDGKSMACVGICHTDKINALKADLADARRQVDELSANTASESALNNALHQCGEYEANVADITAQLEAANEAIDTLRATTTSNLGDAEALQAARDDMLRLQDEAEAAQKERQEFSEFNESLSLRLSDTNAKIADLESKVAADAEALAKAHEDVQQLSADKAAAEQHLLDMVNSAGDNSAAASQLQEQIGALNGEKEDLEDAHLEDIEKIETLENQVAKITAELEVATGASAAAEGEVVAFKAQSELIGQELEAATSARSIAEQEAMELSARFESEQEKVRTLETQLDAAVVGKEQVEQDLARAMDAMSAAMDKISHVEGERDEAREQGITSEELANIQGQLAESNQAVADLEAKLQVSAEACEQAQQQLAATAESSAGLDTQVGRLQEEVLESQERLAASIDAVTQTREQLQAAEDKLETSSQQYVLHCNIIE